MGSEGGFPLGSCLTIVFAIGFTTLLKYIVYGIFALGIVIFVHELGHFLVAKMCGVRCDKFYVGFDPPDAVRATQRII